jgi:hypothetical protein
MLCTLTPVSISPGVSTCSGYSRFPSNVVPGFALGAWVVAHRLHTPPNPSPVVRGAPPVAWGCVAVPLHTVPPALCLPSTRLTAHPFPGSRPGLWLVSASP